VLLGVKGTNLQRVFLAHPTSIAELAVAMEKVRMVVKFLSPVVATSHSGGPVKVVLFPTTVAAAVIDIGNGWMKRGTEILQQHLEIVFQFEVTKHLSMLQAHILI
jgi:hypothetical protein